MSYCFLLLWAALEFTSVEAGDEVGPGFSCKYGEDRSACLQNKDGHSCCTATGDQPDDFYCSGGLVGPPGGSGTNDCGPRVWGIPTGVSIKCCKKKQEDFPAAVVVGGVIVVIVIIVGIAICLCMKQRQQQQLQQQQSATAGSLPMSFHEISVYKPSATHKFGVAFVVANGNVVVQDPGACGAAGLCAGDIVVSVNGLAPTNGTGGASQLVMSAPPGSVLFRVRRPASMHVRTAR